MIMFSDADPLNSKIVSSIAILSANLNLIALGIYLHALGILNYFRIRFAAFASFVKNFS